MYSRRGIRLLKQSEQYNAKLSVLRAKRRKSDLSSFLEKTIRSVEQKIVELKHQSDVCKAKGWFIAGYPCDEALLVNWKYYQLKQTS